MTEKISTTDLHLVLSIMQDIHGLYKIVTKMFSEKNEELLKHFAASAIHQTLFIEDLLATRRIPVEISSSLEKFLAECGCNMKQD